MNGINGFPAVLFAASVFELEFEGELLIEEDSLASSLSREE